MKVCLCILLLFSHLFLWSTIHLIRSSLKHFTVGPAGELGANSSKNIFRFADGSFKLISSKKCCGILLSVQSIMLSSWVSSCVVQSVTGASCGGSGVFEAIAGALFMVEVDADGSVFGVDTQGNLFKETDYYEEKYIVICLNGHKHVTFDLGRLYVICSDGSIMRCI
uniref:Uncharacterized protein n=1 Tax=Cyprinus carpio TaxID=7962 RepID=A0A8C1MCM4_CYPCA